MLDSNQIYMILTNGFDPDLRVYKEAKYLVKNGFKVTILCWDRKCEYVDKTLENLEGIEIRRFHILSKPGTGFKQINSYVRFVFVVRKYLSTKQYTFLHCHDLDGALVGLFTKNRNKKKLVFDMHEFYGERKFKKNFLYNT